MITILNTPKANLRGLQCLTIIGTEGDAQQEYVKFFRLGVDGVFTDFTPTGVMARTVYLHEIGGY